MIKKFKKHPVGFIFCATALFVLVYFTAPVFTGNLEPDEAPSGIMKTLDQVPPTWSQKLNLSERFKFVLDDEAMLDKELGLVWERKPDDKKKDWIDAYSSCYTKCVANRKDWRLPTIEKLTSLTLC